MARAASASRRICEPRRDGVSCRGEPELGYCSPPAASSAAPDFGHGSRLFCGNETDQINYLVNDGEFR